MGQRDMAMPWVVGDIQEKTENSMTRQVAPD